MASHRFAGFVTVCPHNLQPHQDVDLHGDRRGLLQLAWGCLVAAVRGKRTFVPVFDREGEGYHLVLHCRPPAEHPGVQRTWD